MQSSMQKQKQKQEAFRKIVEAPEQCVGQALHQFARTDVALVRYLLHTPMFPDVSKNIGTER